MIDRDEDPLSRKSLHVRGGQEMRSDLINAAGYNDVMHRSPVQLVLDQSSPRLRRIQIVVKRTIVTPFSPPEILQRRFKRS